MAVEGIGLHVEDILVSLVLSIIISRGKPIELCLQNIRLFFLSKAIKQTKAGPRSSGTPFLVLFKFSTNNSHLNFYFLEGLTLQALIFL